jgi:hypothetical protein
VHSISSADQLCWQSLPDMTTAVGGGFLSCTKDSVAYSLCEGGDAVSCPQRAISHFIEKNEHCPLFLAFPLLITSESHRAFMQKVKRKVMLGAHRASAGSVFPAMSLAGCSGGSPASNGTTLKGARWCRPPPWTARMSAARTCPPASFSRIRQESAGCSPEKCQSGARRHFQVGSDREHKD